MEEEDVNKIMQNTIDKLKKEISVEMEKVHEENRKRKEEIELLRDENKKLKKQMAEMSSKMDEVEQYGRKDSLILSGGGFPEVQAGKFEAPEETREITKMSLRKNWASN